MRGELGEVLGRGVRVDDPVAGHAGEADVRHRRERHAVAAHRVQSPKRGLDAGAVVRAGGGDAELAQARDCIGRGDAREGFRLLVEGEHGQDRQRGDAAHGLDRGLELLELEEGLDREEVDAAAFEDRRLLGEDLGALVVETRSSSPSGPIEPAMNTSRPDISRASRASLTAVELMACTSSSR